MVRRQNLNIEEHSAFFAGGPEHQQGEQGQERAKTAQGGLERCGAAGRARRRV